MKSQSEPFKIVKSLFMPTAERQAVEEGVQTIVERVLDESLFSFSIDQKISTSSTPSPQPLKRKKRSYNLDQLSLSQHQNQHTYHPPFFRISDLRLFLVSPLPDRCQITVSVVKDLARLFVFMEKQNRLLITFSEGPRTQFLLDPFCDLLKVLAVRNDMEFKDNGELIAVASKTPLTMKLLQRKRSIRIESAGEWWEGRWEDRRTCVRVKRSAKGGIELTVQGQLSILQAVFVISLIGIETPN